MFKNYSKKYLAEFVYGATDGTVTTFAVISAVSGAELSPAIILILGFSNVLADGFSMAASNYLSEKSDQELHGVYGKKRPFKTAIATFLAFVVVGSIPVVPFAILYNIPTIDPFSVSLVATGIVFILIGYARGRVVGKNPARSALETFIIGAAASAIAYVAGGWIKGLVG